MSRHKLAVVLFNLGGPDGPEAVEPFLFNLFNDPAIIRLPRPLRWLVAKLVSRRRAPIAREIYARLGGRSPILELTQEQAHALEKTLVDEKALGDGAFEVRCFIAMRYWTPFADETARAVKAWAPDEIVLLPLYPHYSTTTTASSLKDWKRAATAAGLSAPVRTVCCYPLEEGFIAAHAALLRAALGRFGAGEKPRVLFSAHGLPKKIVAAGDPYQAQVEASAKAVVAALGIEGLDWRLSYQSRVGPLDWIGPATEAEIEQAGHEGRSLIVVPIAFVSEHSETLVELDIEYRALAEKAGVPRYIRVPALGVEPSFIAGLARLVDAAREQDEVFCPEEAAGRVCGNET